MLVHTIIIEYIGKRKMKKIEETIEIFKVVGEKLYRKTTKQKIKQPNIMQEMKKI